MTHILHLRHIKYENFIIKTRKYNRIPPDGIDSPKEVRSNSNSAGQELK